MSRREKAHAPIALVLVAVLSAVGFATPVAAQIPDEFTNLKLLDPEIEKPQLIETMRGWTMGLGVRCNHCHVGPDNLQEMDFASDEKATKRTARRMLEMSRAINGELLADLPIVDEGESHQVVSCYTCLRGQATPPRNLVDVLADVARESGPDAAIDEYRSLREEHEIAGRYDFREETLSLLSRRYAGAKDFDGALAVLDGAKEFFGDSPSVYSNEGMVKFGAQDPEGARESFEAALALDPEFEPVKRALAQLEAMMERAAAEGGDPEE
jgi:tetratricopeptide (TPR) repeat protein